MRVIHVTQPGNIVKIGVVPPSKILLHITSAGQQGLQGPPGVDVNYVHVQNLPASVWTVNHNLGKFPSVEIVDSAGSRVYCDIDFTDTNSLILTFSAPFGGRAFVN